MVSFMKSIASQSWGAHLACLLVIYKSIVRSVRECGGGCFSGMSDCHMKRLERIEWRAGRFCFGLMRSTHVLSVEVLAGLPPKRNERFLGLVLVKPNDLFMVKLKERHQIWNNSNCLPEWQIFRESRRVSRTHFLTEFDLHLVDLTFAIFASRLMGEVLGELQRPTAIHTDGSKTEGLVGFGIFLDDRDSYRFRLSGHFGIFTAEICAIHFEPMGLRSMGISYRTHDMLFQTRRLLRYLGELGYNITLMWIPFHVGKKGNKRAGVLANEGSISGTLFQDQTGLTTVNTSDIHTRASLPIE
jgi:hypothetical protein